jgi:hypothetical protein
MAERKVQLSAALWRRRRRRRWRRQRRPQLRRNPNKNTRAARLCKCRRCRIISQPYANSRKALRALFGSDCIRVCECERAGAALRWVGGPVRAPHFRAEDAPAVFVKHNERRAGKFRHSASVPRPMMRCATLFGHVQG